MRLLCPPLCPPLCTSQLIVLLSFCCLMISCKDKAQPASTAPVSPSASSKVIDGDTYQVILPDSEVKGLQVEQLIRIIPKPGYKANKDFPHRLKVTSSPKVQATQEEVKGELKETTLQYAVSLKLSSGEHVIKGIADFSICNENMCKLYRGEALQWAVKAP